MDYDYHISDTSHALFEGHLKNYCNPQDEFARARAAKWMIGMVAREDYHPRVRVPDELSEQFSRVCEGLASPTHALEALVGGEAIGRLNIAEGRVGRG